MLGSHFAEFLEAGLGRGWPQEAFLEGFWVFFDRLLQKVEEMLKDLERHRQSRVPLQFVVDSWVPARS